MFNTQGGMMVGDELITDLNSVIEKITQPTTPYVWIFPKVDKPKFKARSWSNADLLEFAIDSIWSSCQEFCTGDCDCSDIAKLMKRRFKNV